MTPRARRTGSVSREKERSKGALAQGKELSIVIFIGLPETEPFGAMTEEGRRLAGALLASRLLPGDPANEAPWKDQRGRPGRLFRPDDSLYFLTDSRDTAADLEGRLWLTPGRLIAGALSDTPESAAAPIEYGWLPRPRVPRSAVFEFGVELPLQNLRPFRLVFECVAPDSSSKERSRRRWKEFAASGNKVFYRAFEGAN